MIVYGDRVRSVETRALLAEIGDRLAQSATMAPGVARHGALAGALLAAGELAQGLADAAQARAGHDDVCAEVDVAMGVVRSLSIALLRSWRSGFRDCATRIDLPTLRLPDQIEARTAEGFAFYAVYPEAYAAAAPRGTAQVIGLRSIGVVLGSVVAVAMGAGLPLTVRPVGHPFARTLRLADRLQTAMQAAPEETRVIVDEGPGASGSSFGSVADWLEGHGVAAERIVFMPSHPGPPGPHASVRHRARWGRAVRPVVTFDDLCLATPRPEHRLANWFADLVGPAAGPLQDLSGGAWRAGRDVPCAPALERRKFLLHTASGAWLLKFIGLGRIGEEKFQLARTLHAAGFTPEPIALRHGFLMERWHADAAPGAPDVQRLGFYIGFRARHCPAGAADGASGAKLREMASHNMRERFGAAAAIAPDFVEAPRVRIDGRLHAWEWLRLPDGRLLKADALDHHAAHDLIGSQPIAWDVAGAIVEFDLSDAEAARLRRIVDHQAGYETDPRQVAAHIVFYCAFQLALWPGSERYERRLMPPRYPP